MNVFKKIIKAILNRFVIISVLILVQFGLFFWTLQYFESYSTYVHVFAIVLSYILILYILNKEELSTYKIPWIIIILVLPLAGSIAYLMFGSVVLPKKMVRKIQSHHDKIISNVNKNKDVYDNLKEENISAFGQANYISQSSKNSLYNNSEITYFSIGEEMHKSMISEMKKAKKYIFLEFFIISEGKMWDSIHEVLLEKVKEGIEVRVMYDDVGSIKHMKNKFKTTLESEGIKCCCFNPYRPIASVAHNNRDHRKLLIIDGKLGYTGGVNIADEYINEINLFGHWEDSGVLIKGESVSNMIAMFLRSWDLYYKTKDEDFCVYFPEKYEEYENGGYSLMFGDGPKPLDNEYIGENAYLNIINQAKKNLYIMTPYFIVDQTMVNALINASLRGVDVRIILPHIPDKKLIFMITKSYYFQLLKKGIKIYEYTPGFVHSKLVLCDDEIAINGTINFDYRSFVHHFECACWMYKVNCIDEMYEDYFKTVEKSEEIKIENVKKGNIFKRLFLAFLRFFAPLL